MALILYRVMRPRLKLAGSQCSPEAALERLRRVQRHTVTINRGAPVRASPPSVKDLHQLVSNLGAPTTPQQKLDRNLLFSMLTTKKFPSRESPKRP